MIQISCTEKEKELIETALNESPFPKLYTRIRGDVNIAWDIQPEPLKPCPFCGSADVEVTTCELVDDIRYWVICNNCCASSDITYEKEKAIEKWDERVGV